MKKFFVMLIMVLMMASTAYGAEKEHEFDDCWTEVETDESGNKIESVYMVRDDDEVCIRAIKVNDRLDKIVVSVWMYMDEDGRPWARVITIG